MKRGRVPDCVRRRSLRGPRIRFIIRGTATTSSAPLPQAGHQITDLPAEPWITMQDAYTARTSVILGAGARLPKRDAVDVRVLLQVLGLDSSPTFFIDTPRQVGGGGRSSPVGDGLPRRRCRPSRPRAPPRQRTSSLLRRAP